MRAMILAAGRGERMGDLTLNTPKPLLQIADNFLIEYAIYNCKRAGIRDIIINVSYHGAQIKAALGDGDKYNLRIQYSEEPERLEVGGGILKALPLLGSDPFIVVSGDVMTDYPLDQLKLRQHGLAHLILVDNPYFHPEGDFGLHKDIVDFAAKPKLTFGNIGIYDPKLFADSHAGFFSWRKLMFPAIQNKQVTGEYFKGKWHNVGNPIDLKHAREDSNLRP